MKNSYKFISKSVFLQHSLLHVFAILGISIFIIQIKNFSSNETLSSHRFFGKIIYLTFSHNKEYWDFNPKLDFKNIDQYFN